MPIKVLVYYTSWLFHRKENLYNSEDKLKKKKLWNHISLIPVFHKSRDCICKYKMNKFFLQILLDLQMQN